MQQVIDAVLPDVGPQPDRGWPGGTAFVALGGGEVAARARVGALRRMGCGRRVEDLSAGAETLEGAAGVAQVVEDGTVCLEPVGLVDDGRVPVEAQGREIGQLPGIRTLDGSVEILHPDQELSAGGPREEPGEHGGPQIADVEVSGGGGRVPARSLRRHRVEITGRR